MKMKNKNLTFIWCLLFLVIACTSKPEASKDKVADDRQVYQINFEESLGVEKPLMLSEIADTIEYLQLKTPKDVIITSIRQVIVSDESIFVISRGIPYQFHREGNFIRQIGAKGKGPGEYIGVTAITFDEDKDEIAIFDYTANILYYKIDGSFVRSQKIYPNYPIARSDSVIWANGSGRSGDEKYLVIALGMDMDTLCVIPNYIFYKSKNNPNIDFTVMSRYQRSVYESNHNLFFKGGETNDTIWELKLPKPEVHAVLNMGKYKLPVEYQPGYSRSDFVKNADKYYRVPWIYEDDRYFFFLSQPWTGKFGFPMVFDKQTGEGFVVRNKAAGLTDDLLHGPSFWPSFISGDYYVGAIEAYDLMERLSGTESAYFKKLLSTIDENSNQLLILCKRK